MNHVTKSAIAAFAAVSLAGAATAALSDAIGDAQDTFGLGEPLLDVSQWDVSYDDTTLYFSVDFETPISPPGSGEPNALAGLLEFDTDQDVLTGGVPIQNGFGVFAILDSGVDFILDLSGVLLDSSFNVIDFVDVSYTETSVSGSFGLDLLGDDGVLNYTGTIGTFGQPTDATDAVGTSMLIPAPGAIGLLGLAGFAGRTRRRMI